MISEFREWIDKGICGLIVRAELQRKIRIYIGVSMYGWGVCNVEWLNFIFGVPFVLYFGVMLWAWTMEEWKTCLWNFKNAFKSIWFKARLGRRDWEVLTKLAFFTWFIIFVGVVFVITQFLSSGESYPLFASNNRLD